MAFDFNAIGLVDRGGIWYAKQNAPVSYPEHGNDIFFTIEEYSFWFKHRNNCIKEIIKRHPFKGAFFDIGGGNGYVARGIQEIGVETILVEPGEKGCVNAKRRNINNVVCSTVEDAGFEKNSMPAIGVFDVVEHFKDDVGLLSTLHGYLQKDGLLFITVPAFNFLWSNEDDYAGHYNRYTLGGLEKKLESVGFKVVYDTYIFSILPLPVFLLRSIPSRLGMRKQSDYESKKPSEHKSENPLLTKIWNWELKKIQRGERIPMGGSCMVVARKV